MVSHTHTTPTSAIYGVKIPITAIYSAYVQSSMPCTCLLIVGPHILNPLYRPFCSRRGTYYPSPHKEWLPSSSSTSFTALMPSVPTHLLHSSLSCCNPLLRMTVLHWVSPAAMPCGPWNGGFWHNCLLPPCQERFE